MGDVLTLTVQGEGGGRWDMDVPAAGSHAREHFESKIASGQLTVLDNDGEGLSATVALEMITEHGGDAPADERKVRGGVPVGATAPVESVEPPRVGPGSSRDAWASYATGHGIDVGDMNRAEIIAAVDAGSTSDTSEA